MVEAEVDTCQALGTVVVCSFGLLTNAFLLQSFVQVPGLAAILTMAL